MQVDLKQILKIFDDERSKMNKKMNELYSEGKDNTLEFHSYMNSWAFLSVMRNKIVNKLNGDGDG